MLLTITYEGEDTQNLGFLLHKNPERSQAFTLPFGNAYVFYPEVSLTRTTAALLLDIDPINLARGKEGGKPSGMFDYVNDRPYATSSFMSTAIARVFGTALSGRCNKMQELADTPLKLTAKVYSLKDHCNETLAKEIFEPLGYSVITERPLLDEKFPEWGISPYINLTLSGTVRLSQLLNHLYVLIPVFDMKKHYYMDKAEVDKLLEHGKGWLADHPAKEKIIKRYFHKTNSFIKETIKNLIEDDTDEVASVNESNKEYEMKEPEAASFSNSTTEVGEDVVSTDKHVSLNTLRMQTVKSVVLESGASSVLDLGCGEGRLISLLLPERQIRNITACDVSVSVLEKAARRLHIDRMNPYIREKLNLIQASLTYRDKRFEGFDCACLIEVIEHIDPLRLPAVERILFEFSAPKTVIVTTPNREYNENYSFIEDDSFRHGDHRFEWTRDEFKNWTEDICERFGYYCEISGIGDMDEERGAPTQMGVFRKNG